MESDLKPAEVEARIEPELQPQAEVQLSEEARERRSQKSRVLSRKAVERTLILEKSSRSMIDTSRELVSRSKERNANAHRTLARRRLAA